MACDEVPTYNYNVQISNHFSLTTSSLLNIVPKERNHIPTFLHDLEMRRAHYEKIE